MALEDVTRSSMNAANGVGKLESLKVKNPELSSLSNPLVLIPTYNNGPYLENCLQQFQTLGFNNFLVLDGGSSDRGTSAFLKTLSDSDRLINLLGNPGPRFFFENHDFYRALPEIFVVTDPDLEFNSDLPEDFITTLFNLSLELKSGKVGFALNIDGDLKRDEFFFGKRWTTIKEWESQHWKDRVANSLDLEVYRAPIDTTFALYNKRFLDKKSFFEGYRVAGSFTAKHLPWHVSDDLVHKLPKSIDRGKFSTWSAGDTPDREREAFRALVDKINAMESSVSWRITAPLRALGKIIFGAKRFFPKKLD